MDCAWVLCLNPLIPSTGSGPRHVWHRVRASRTCTESHKPGFREILVPFSELANLYFPVVFVLLSTWRGAEQTARSQFVLSLGTLGSYCVCQKVKNLLQCAQLKKENPAINSLQNTKKPLMEKSRPFHYSPISTMQGIKHLN